LLEDRFLQLVVENLLHDALGCNAFVICHSSFTFLGLIALVRNLPLDASLAILVDRFSSFQMPSIRGGQRSANPIPENVKNADSNIQRQFAPKLQIAFAAAAR
jgi:hypothetical protein